MINAMSACIEVLRTLIARHAPPVSGPIHQLPGVVLGREMAPTPPCLEILEPMLSVVVQGSKRMTVARQSVSYSVGQYMIVPIDLPIDAHVIAATSETPFLGFGMALSPEAIAELLGEGGMSATPKGYDAGLWVDDLGDDLLDPIIRLLRLLDRPSDIPILGKSIQREILWRLITGPRGKIVREIGTVDSHVARIRCATRWLRAHWSEGVTIDQVAAVAGMSVTSLHRHFRGITSMTPIQYQKQLRLQAARTRLMTGLENVAEVGFAVEYDSLSQFHREYCRMFGMSPGRDAAKFRAGLSIGDSTRRECVG